MNINELERVLLDQIEKLNDDSLANTPEEARAVIEKSKAMSALASNVMQINHFKLEAVKEFGRNGDAYATYLGLEDKSNGKA